MSRPKISSDLVDDNYEILFYRDSRPNEEQYSPGCLC